jgi:hypothetical protein
MTTATKTARYALIDSNTGYVWGIATGETPEAACAIVDHDIDPSEADARQYESITASDRGRDHYLVYDATTLDGDVTDGQDQEQIDRVSALPLVARIGWTERE